jgi:ribosomal protein S25
MAIGTRQQTEKNFDKKARDGKTKRSWKWEKQKQNRRLRRAARVDPEDVSHLKKYAGWEH